MAVDPRRHGPRSVGQDGAWADTRPVRASDKTIQTTTADKVGGPALSRHRRCRSIVSPPWPQRAVTGFARPDRVLPPASAGFRVSAAASPLGAADVEDVSVPQPHGFPRGDGLEAVFADQSGPESLGPQLPGVAGCPRGPRREDMRVEEVA